MNLAQYHPTFQPPVYVPIRRTMHKPHVIPANDTKGSVWTPNYSSLPLGSNLKHQRPVHSPLNYHHRYTKLCMTYSIHIFVSNTGKVTSIVKQKRLKHPYSLEQVHRLQNWEFGESSSRKTCTVGYGLKFVWTSCLAFPFTLCRVL